MEKLVLFFYYFLLKILINKLSNLLEIFLFLSIYSLHFSYIFIFVAIIETKD